MSRVREAARAVVPKPARDAVRNLYWAGRRWEERTPQQLAVRHLVERLGGVVPAGPFAGMRSLTTMDDGCIVPKLLGCYEEEIHSWIEVLLRRRPALVIDVGCASGWYTTGFAMRLPEARVLGYDLDPGALERAAQLAALNGVADRVTLREQRLTPEALSDLVEPGRTLIFVDIDGPELELLDPDRGPRLLEADVLVELHDHVDPTISTTIVERFRGTHEVHRVHALGRDPAHYPELSGIRSRWVRAAAVAERRPAAPRQEFAVLLRREADAR